MHRHNFEIVPIGVDFKRDNGKIRKPLPYSLRYLKVCKNCNEEPAEIIESSQIREKRKEKEIV